MIILVSSKISHKNIQASLGKPEYSYFFLMRDFLPALERIGKVIQIEDLDELDSLYIFYSERGEQVVFLSVSPPHQTPLDTVCPTINLFAWEFDSLPDRMWDDEPRNDWGYVFSRIRGAICTSREAARLVGDVAGSAFPVIALPAPIWDRYACSGGTDGGPLQLDRRCLEFSGIVIDSPMLGLSADGLVRKPEPRENELSDEPGGSVETPPRMGWLQACQLSKALLAGWLREIRQSEVSSEAERKSRAPAELEAVRLDVNGVVYTTVLNPADGRKNWVDIVTAFCWAFKDREDATLIIKMTHHDLEYYRVVLLTLLSRLAPFQCRVLILHGFLTDTQYRELIKISTYYVNASTGEGLCLPLMEFLATGKPAIAPAHTAMADYVTPQLAFILHSSLEPACWPHDPTGMLFTHTHRLDWQSLMKAFRDSYDVAVSDSSRYRGMSHHAYHRMQEFASIARVAEPLEEFLKAATVRDHASQKETLS